MQSHSEVITLTYEFYGATIQGTVFAHGANPLSLSGADQGLARYKWQIILQIHVNFCLNASFSLP